MNEHFDVIIIGTGAGGGTLLHRLAASGKRIRALKRGPFLPREKDNWSYHGSFKYHSSEVMREPAFWLCSDKKHGLSQGRKWCGIVLP